MAHKKERDFNAILIEAVKLNNLSYADVMYICEKSESTVFKWLNGSLVPDKGSMLQIFKALFKAQLKIPLELNRLESSLYWRAAYWAKQNRSNTPTEYTGEKKRKRPTAVKFIYKNRLISRDQISDESGLSFAGVYQRTKHCTENSDVTAIIERKKWKRTNNA